MAGRQQVRGDYSHPVLRHPFSIHSLAPAEHADHHISEGSKNSALRVTLQKKGYGDAASDVLGSMTPFCLPRDLPSNTCLLSSSLQSAGLCVLDMPECLLIASPASTFPRTLWHLLQGRSAQSRSPASRRARPVGLWMKRQ